MLVPTGGKHAPRPRNGRGSFFGTVIVTVVVVLALGGVGFGVWNLVAGAGGGGQSASSASSSTPETPFGTPTDHAAPSSGEASGGASGSAADGDLSWRDKDFAVDPSRTDWSFSDNGRKVVYLTIDDGPSENTQAVLDILDKYGCKATFFVVGHDPDYYHMIKEAYDRGHTIGLHTMSHDYAIVYSSIGAYFDDLDQIGQVVQDQIGYVPCFIRFPGGSSNGISAQYSQGIMTQLVEDVQARGYQYYDWNISTGDGSDHTADELYEYATEPNASGEYDTNIVMLCHDSATKQTTVEALPRIIEFYQGMGYSFEAIDRSTWVCHHGVAN